MPPRARLHGFLNLRKPAGMTSHDCVDAARKALGMREVGHGGTLDPMATGVLVLGVGRATKFLQYLRADKEYSGTIRYGIITRSDDITSDVLSRQPVPDITEAQVRDVLQRFVGEIDQVPPRVCALQQNGRRLHELARNNVEFEVKPRRVMIHALEMLKFVGGDFPEASIRVRCGPGTYIRSIARESGEQLLIDRGPSRRAAGGTLVQLERSRSGGFSLEQSLRIEDIRSVLETGQSPLQPIESALDHLPSITLDAIAASKWLRGDPVHVPASCAQPATLQLPTSSSPSTFSIYDDSQQRSFLGVTHAELASGVLTMRRRTIFQPVTAPRKSRNR